MQFIRYLLILLSGFLGAGYTASPSQPPPNRVVTQIQVTVIHDGQAASEIFTDSESMESILTYLRLTNATTIAGIDPDSFRSDAYQYILTFSNGDTAIYRQIHYEYLQRNSEPWRRISPKADLLFPSL